MSTQLPRTKCQASSTAGVFRQLMRVTWAADWRQSFTSQEITYFFLFWILKFWKLTFWELTFWDQLHLILHPRKQLIWLKNFPFSGLSRFSLFGFHNTRKQKNTILLSYITVNAIKSAKNVWGLGTIQAGGCWHACGHYRCLAISPSQLLQPSIL